MEEITKVKSFDAHEIGFTGCDVKINSLWVHLKSFSSIKSVSCINSVISSKVKFTLIEKYYLLENSI